MKWCVAATPSVSSWEWVAETVRGDVREDVREHPRDASWALMERNFT
jgi:hypothetical protein